MSNGVVGEALVLPKYDIVFVDVVSFGIVGVIVLDVFFEEAAVVVVLDEAYFLAF